MVAVCTDIKGLAPNLTVPMGKSYTDHYMKERFAMQCDIIHCERWIYFDNGSTMSPKNISTNLPDYKISQRNIVCNHEQITCPDSKTSKNSMPLASYNGLYIIKLFIVQLIHTNYKILISGTNVRVHAHWYQIRNFS